MIAFLKSYSQSQEIKRNLQLLTFNNNQLESIVDSVITFSENCEKVGLKYLTFSLNIQETEFNNFQITITLIDCQGLYFILTSSDIKNKPLGFFEYRNRNFIVSGNDDITKLFTIKDSNKEFSSYSPTDSFMSDYTLWIYTMNSENRIKLSKFYPICEPKRRILPDCYDKKKE